jgi:hypothetical protein
MEETMQLRNGGLCVLALDPGGSTGWAAYHAEVVMAGLDQPEFYNQFINQGQLGPQEHHLDLWNLLGDMHVANYVIVCESFEYRREQRDNVVLISKEYIGVVNLFVQERSKTLPRGFVLEHVPQNAATGKSFWYPKVKGKKDSWDGSRLKHLGLYQPTTQGRHKNDATAHLLQWLSEGPFKQRQWYQKIKDL